MFTAITKSLYCQYRKNGNAYVDYIIHDSEGYIKSISPNKWLHLNLPDITNEYQTKKCYNILLEQWKKTHSFGQFLDVWRAGKAKGFTQDNEKELYLIAIGV